MLARRGLTLQKMEMPKQTRHRKLKVLEMPSEVRRDSLTLTHMATLAQTPYGMEKQTRFYVLFSLSILQHRLNSLKPRHLLGPDPQSLVTSVLGNLDFPVMPLRWHLSKQQWFRF
ncbi:hypothetical protein H8959_021076 [Pygathrix nigripes]